MSLDTSRGWGTAILWFRRDLRLHDQPALAHALANARTVVPLFVLDPRLTGGAGNSPARVWFMARSLEALDAELRARGSGLVLRSGDPESIVPEVARELSADVVVVSGDVTPRAHRRDVAVARALGREGRRLVTRPGILLVEPEEMLTGSGAPYRVFTPFWRSLRAAPRRELEGAPSRIPTPPEIGAGPGIVLPPGLPNEPPVRDLPAPGEAAARRRLEAWVERGIAGYAAGRDRLDGSATSRLGADLHLGLLSPRQVEDAAAAAGEAATAFLRQVAWRELYHHQAFHRRALGSLVPDGPFGGVFRAEGDAPEAVAAWRTGRTGIPVVDAAMRQLRTTGWLSNRARLIVASFLTRHLLMHHRIGERHFLRHLIDGDVANNAGGWQWTAGVGADPQPWFRIFNPVLQGRRFDPDGDWVRRWLPELARIPGAAVHAPWELSEAEQDAAGVRSGQDYPRPIVDLAAARERALEAFRRARGDPASPGLPTSGVRPARAPYRG